jgi:phosphoglycolate phosphatase-like HAD superfamily hydrolase
MSGKTDPQIVHEYLALLGVADAEIHVPGILEQLEVEMAAGEHLVRAHGVALPGVTELLARLSADVDVDVVQTVLTGNIAPNAEVKLAAFGLDRWLDLEIGAFGSDHADRTELVPVALRRARDLRGREFAADEVWVVGDTANDLACARAAGVRCLLVATGRPGFEELGALGPDALRRDLHDVDEAVELLLS